MRGPAAEIFHDAVDGTLQRRALRRLESFGVHVGADYPGVVPAISKLAIPGAAFLLRPGAHAAAGFASRFEPWLIARTPALTGTDAHRGLVEILERGRDLLRVTHLLHEFLQLFGGTGQ